MSQKLYDDLAILLRFYTFEISGESPNPPQEVIWLEDRIDWTVDDKGDITHSVKSSSGFIVDESYIFLDEGLKYKTKEILIPGFPKPLKEASWLRFLDKPQEGWTDTNVLDICYHISNPHPYKIECHVCAELQDINTGETIREVCKDTPIPGDEHKYATDLLRLPNLGEIPAGTYNLLIKSDNDEIGPIKINFVTPDSIFSIAKCPVDLIISDPEDRTINKQSTEIIGATYAETDLNGDGDPDDLIIIPDRKTGEYQIIVIPEPDAEPTDTYTLEVSSGDTTIVLAEDIPISDIPDWPYILRSTEEGIFQIIPATMRIEPETLNLGSNGVFTAFIQLPEGYDVSDITLSTVECESAPAIEGKIVDGGEGGHHDMGHVGGTLKVKFNRQDLVDVPAGDAVKLTVTGRVLYNGEEVDFEGSDTIQVIDKGKGK